MQQLALPLTPEDHAHLLHPAGLGKVTIARREGDRWLEQHFAIADLPQVAASLKGVPDVYITQNRFYGRRLIANLAQADALFADLDYYRVPALHQSDPLMVFLLACERLQDARIPGPDLAISTGRGLALLWLHSPVPRAALPRWNACQKHLFETLKPLGADAKALDAARVLRMVGTINSTANTAVACLETRLRGYWDFDFRG